MNSCPPARPRVTRPALKRRQSHEKARSRRSELSVGDRRVSENGVGGSPRTGLALKLVYIGQAQ
ncbi:hypothetical protein CALVIDRAFT_535438 [Calocera viscosa TUFC12733]|uniref:Uncharacterized protein n=1 Tax=Calocera viscosa (strain TUFC12733) TaxID=1330018 RepID=A0A167P2U9_CALVF|nr:hypothetical protein CALVIDRAFT_535438 [Calocera viscosa TUFC12733]